MSARQASGNSSSSGTHQCGAAGACLGWPTLGAAHHAHRPRFHAGGQLLRLQSFSGAMFLAGICIGLAAHSLCPPATRLSLMPTQWTARVGAGHPSALASASVLLAGLLSPGLGGEATRSASRSCRSLLPLTATPITRAVRTVDRVIHSCGAGLLPWPATGSRSRVEPQRGRDAPPPAILVERHQGTLRDQLTSSHIW